MEGKGRSSTSSRKKWSSYGLPGGGKPIWK